MSVMIISPQMIADVTKKAQTFRNYGFSHEEKMMCPTLAEMNDKDIRRNEYKVKEYFFRLYQWNDYSAALSHMRVRTPSFMLRNDFDNSLNRAKDIDIYQFEEILRFLHYNIENYEFNESLSFKKQMDEDVELLGKMCEEVCQKIVSALQDEKGCKWYY